jgi:2',3'-cyclic-nucleotide 2'-phosphodiesterase (5'-nucleotidase family)
MRCPPHPTRADLLALALVAGLALHASACVRFNQACDVPPDLIDPDRTIGYLAEPMLVKESLVRTREMAIGNLVADAYADAYDDPANPSYRAAVDPVLGAFQNAGGIRDEGFCAPVEALPGAAENPPPLRRADLREVMPFANRVVVVELTGKELYEVFEHSVSALRDAEDPNRGFFLQVSAGFKVEVDCSRTPQEVVEGRISQPGDRVTALWLGGTLLDRADESTRYRVATNDFLLRTDGNDGFVTLAGRPGLNSLGRLDVEAVEDYLGLKSGPTAPYQPVVEGRIQLVGCE